MPNENCNHNEKDNSSTTPLVYCNVCNRQIFGGYVMVPRNLTIPPPTEIQYTNMCHRCYYKLYNTTQLNIECNTINPDDMPKESNLRTKLTKPTKDIDIIELFEYLMANPKIAATIKKLAVLDKEKK